MALFSTAGLARGSARHPWLIVLLWICLIAGAAVAQGGLESALDGDDSFTNSPDAKKGDDLIEDRLRGTEPMTETVIVRSESTTVDDPAFQAEVERTTGALLAYTEGVAGATSYYDALAVGDQSAEQLVSADRHTTLIPVTLVGDEESAPEPQGYVDLVEGLGGNGFEVLSVGSATTEVAFDSIVSEDIAKGEMIGIPIAIVVLIVVFGALVAVGLPLILALVSIFIAVGLAALVGQIIPLEETVISLITMIGLAVGIDYALFVVERYREERLRGIEKHAAIERAGATASKSVVFSGFTVIIALLGMFLIPVTVFQALGIGAALVVIVAVVANLTLIPAMLSILGDKIDWPRRRRKAPVQHQSVHDPAAIYRGFWGRITRVVMARPAISAILATGILVAAAFSFTELKTGEPGLNTLPESNVKSAYQILSTDFYAGVLDPVEIVIDAPANDPETQAGVTALVTALGEDPRYGPAAIETNDAGDLTLVSVPMSLDSNDPAAETAVKELRATTIPAAFDGVSAEVYVTGEAAFNRDFNTILADYTPIVFAFVLGLSFLLLMIAFRSIVVPLMAIILNLLSVGAAYGLLVLVFQKGVGADLLGLQESPVITAWIPIFLFCILFGLSMDYHVFLLSRIREHYDLTKRNRESVAFGLHATAKIITGAAVIMVAVFSGFAAGRLVDMQQMGFGLAVAVLIDATIVRSILVPASMSMLGKWNWYLPRWLEWLPDLRVEGPAEPDDTEAAPGAASADLPGTPQPQSHVPPFVPDPAVAFTSYPHAAYVEFATPVSAPTVDDRPESTRRPVRENAFLRIIGVPFEGRTYHSIAYLLLSLPLGIAYFTLLIVGFAVGIGSILAVLGIPILILTISLAWKFMSLERHLAGNVLGQSIPGPFSEADQQPSFWTRLKARLRHRSTYKGIAFLFAKLPIGVLSFALTTFAVSVPVALALTLVTFPFDDTQMNFFGREIDTIQEALACTIAAPIVILLAMHALNGLAGLFARFARGAVGGTV